MPPNPHAPGTAGTPDPQVDVSAEMERAKEIMLSNVMGHLRTLKLDKRRKMMDLMGTKTPDAVRTKIDGWNGVNKWLPFDAMQAEYVDLSAEKGDITRIMLEQNAALSDLMPEVMNPATKTVEVGGRRWKLRDLLMDPESEDAKSMFVVYQQFNGKANTDWAKILRPVELSPDDVKRLKAVEELRTEYATLMADATLHGLKAKRDALDREYTKLDLRTSGTPTPSTVATSAPNAPAIAINTGDQKDTTAETERMFARMREIDAERGTNDTKRVELEAKLKSVDAKGVAVASNPGAVLGGTWTPKTFTPAEIDTFGPSTSPFPWASQHLMIDTDDHEIGDWIKKPEQGQTITTLKARAKRGKAKISANDALNEMLRTNYRATETNATPAEIEALVKQMRQWMGRAPTSAAAATPAAAAEAAKKEDKKDGDKKPETLLWSTWLHSAWEGVSGGVSHAWKGAYDYMTEEGSSFLGFHTADTKKGGDKH